MRNFLLRHIIFIIGAVLLIIIPEQMSAYGFLIVLLYILGAWIPVLIINIITFVLGMKSTARNSLMLRYLMLILAFLGGAAGVYIAMYLELYYPDNYERDKIILRYALELNIFLLAVLPLFTLITGLFKSFNKENLHEKITKYIL